MVFSELDVPSRICLGLTSKFFAGMSSMVSTELNDLPSIVKYHHRCPKPPCPYVNHISDRRILMLELKRWMPRGYRLCWICCKYSKIDKTSKWHSTTRMDLGSPNRINLPALVDLHLRRVFCHHKCLDSGRALSKWVWAQPGASGGFTRFTGSCNPPPLGHVYDAGF